MLASLPQEPNIKVSAAAKDLITIVCDTRAESQAAAAN